MHEQAYDEDEEAPGVMELLRNPQVLALVLSNLGMCMTSELLFNVYPLFAYTPIESGELLLFPLWFSYLLLVVVTIMPPMSNRHLTRIPSHTTHQPPHFIIILRSLFHFRSF